MKISKLLPATFVLFGLGAQLSGSALAQFSAVKFSDVQLSSLNSSSEFVVNTTAKTEAKIASEIESSASPFESVEPAMLTNESDLIVPIQTASTEQTSVLIGEGTLDDSDNQLKLEGGIRIDHFNFDGEAGEEITITGESSDFDIVVGLFLIEEDQLREIAINDNASETTTNARIEATLDTTGTYAVIVGPAFAEGQGDYVVTLEGTGES